MGTSKTFSVKISYEITSANEEWRSVMENGQPAPSVTGGVVQLPQGGTRESRAAVTGGIFTEGSEAGSYAEENAKKIIESLMPAEIQDSLSNIIENGDISDLEFFLTNIAKSEYMKIAAEFSDNADEAQATEAVINSIKVTLNVSGLPTKEEITAAAKELIMSMLHLGGGS